MSRKRLVLAGAGHAHLVALHNLAQRPDPLLDIALVSPDIASLYSGMVPGCIAGHYTRSELTLPARALVEKIGGRFIRGEVRALDLSRRVADVTACGDIAWDILSIDVGAPSSPPGAEPATPSRPASALLDAVEAGNFDDATPENRVLVVGGGPAGVEIALALDHRLTGARRDAPPVALVAGRAGLLPGLPHGARRRIERILARRSMQVVTGRDVVGVHATSALLDDGTRLPATSVVWAAGVRAHEWLRGSGVPVDASGFACVDATLRVCGREDVFCVGDAACFQAAPLPKAGVHAVRQGELLVGQFRATARGLPLAAYRPQRDMLVLIATGPRHAVACRNGMSVEGRWAWWWKDAIDRRFVARLRAG